VGVLKKATHEALKNYFFFSSFFTSAFGASFFASSFLAGA
jgi:hypothetical protein